MNNYTLNVNSPIIGGYFSSEQIDLLSIIQCHNLNELMEFVTNCDQINRVKGILESINNLDLESAKRKIFRAYQDTMVYHDQNKNDSKINRLNYLGLHSQEELMSVIDKTHPKSEEILSLNHHFVSEERDQIKSEDLYDEMLLLNSQLSYFNSMLIGSGKIYCVVNKYDLDSKKRFDFYHAKRDLDFAYKNKKQVRFHSLLVKDDNGLFENKSKEQIMELIKVYVKESVDFINNYNSNHKININGKEEPVINAVDLFNEIISFESKNGEYYNIWEEKYNITLPELMSCFDYALKNKPEGVSYLYNEPFLENDERRKKVFEVLNQMTLGLIDTLGSQMHITIHQNLDSIKRCFEDLKKVQDSGMKVQITEFDMCLGRLDIPRVFGPNADVTLKQVYQEKDNSISKISQIINDSGVKLSGVSYWSLTDGIDSNLERIRSNALAQHQINNIKDIPTACGGLIPTHKRLVKKNELNQMMNPKKVNNTPTVKRI